MAEVGLTRLVAKVKRIHSERIVPIEVLGEEGGRDDRLVSQSDWCTQNESLDSSGS
jgi:hypothetical protein